MAPKKASKKIGKKLPTSKKAAIPLTPINRDLAMGIKPGEILIDGPTFYLGRAAWLLLTHTAYQDGGRRNLHCIHFDRSGDVIATDGSRLFICKHGRKRPADPRVVSFNLDFEHAITIRRAMNDDDCVAVTCHDDRGEQLTATVIHRTPTLFKSVQAIPIPIVPGYDSIDFPNCSSLIKQPGGVPAGAWGIDPGLLGSMCVDLARVIDGPGIYVRAWSELDPIHLETTHGASWLGVIMPMRI